jgi:hypothetical protein
MVGASAALTLSGVPFMGPIGGARVGYINGEYVLNPLVDEMPESARSGRRRHHRCRADGGIGSQGTVRRRHARRGHVRPQRLPAGDRRDHQAGRKCRQGAARLQPEDLSAAGRRDGRLVEADLPRPTRSPTRWSARRDRAVKDRVKVISHRPEGEDKPAGRRMPPSARLQVAEAKVVRGNILKTKTRIDGRDLSTVRPIVAEVGVLPRTHGSALFTRGETQALVVATLGTGEDEQFIDALRTYKETSCCTTTSRPTRSVKRAAWVLRAAARSATASWPGAPSIRCCRRRNGVPLHAARCLRDHRVQRLVLDGDRLRHLAVADGCRRAAEGAGGRYRHGPDQGRRRVRRPVRHSR